MNSQLCLILNFASTWAMVGVIWIIQIVHYPLFASVGSDQFRGYEQDHQRLITYIVLPLMFCELITSGLLWVYRPVGSSAVLIGIGIALVLLIWGSTFLLQVPQHGQLGNGFDAAVHQKLVSGNWIRTVAWTLRGLVVGYLVWRSMA